MTDVAMAENKQKPAARARIEDERERKKRAKVQAEMIEALSFDQLLGVFYEKLFPFKMMFEWLSYGDPNYFLCRELSYTLKIQGDEIYARYKSYPTAVAFSAAIIKENPIKIDIGAKYPCAPADRMSIGANFVPLERELVLDIDMTDYDPVRFCCSGAEVCGLCWGLMKTAVKVVDPRLRADFGFRHIMWVFSGRRGIHCWVADAAARALDAAARGTVLDYLTATGGGDEQVRKCQLPARVHPALQEAYNNVLLPFFVDEYMEDQELLTHPDRYPKVLELIPMHSLRQELADSWAGKDRWDITAAERWAQLKKAAERERQTLTTKFNQPHLIMEIVFTFVYPRFDQHVSRGLNHLLKSPFCVHPKTGRVCVPFDPNRVNDFDPGLVPKVGELVAKLSAAESADAALAAATDAAAAAHAAGESGRHDPMLEMSHALDVLKGFLKGLQQETRAQRFEQVKEKLRRNDIKDLL